jgi:hypothetical protein
MTRLPGLGSEEPALVWGGVFEVYGGLPAQGGVSPAAVMEALDVLVASDIRLCLLPAPVTQACREEHHTARRRPAPTSCAGGARPT